MNILSEWWREYRHICWEEMPINVFLAFMISVVEYFLFRRIADRVAEDFTSSLLFATMFGVLAGVFVLFALLRVSEDNNIKPMFIRVLRLLILIVMPLGVGLLVFLYLQSIENYRVAIEITGVLCAVLSYYLYFQFYNYKRKAELDVSLVAFKNDARASTEIFMTSVIPHVIPSFERRFQPDLMQQITLIAGRYTKTTKHVTNEPIIVILGGDRHNVEPWKQFLSEGMYAKAYISMNQELGFHLAYVSEKDFKDILTNAKITVPEYLNKKYDYALLKVNGKDKIWAPGEKIMYNKMSYWPITDAELISEYIHITKELKNAIYDSSDNMIREKYDLYRFI